MITTFWHLSLHDCDVIGEVKGPVVPQNRTQFIAIGTNGAEIRKLEISFAPHWISRAEKFAVVAKNYIFSGQV